MDTSSLLAHSYILQTIMIPIKNSCRNNAAGVCFIRDYSVVRFLSRYLFEELSACLAELFPVMAVCLMAFHTFMLRMDVHRSNTRNLLARVRPIHKLCPHIPHTLPSRLSLQCNYIPIGVYPSIPPIGGWVFHIGIMLHI